MLYQSAREGLRDAEALEDVGVGGVYMVRGLWKSPDQSQNAKVDGLIDDLFVKGGGN